MMTHDDLIDLISKIVKSELKRNNLLTGDWHVGTVTEVVSSKKLRVKVDGSTTDQLISCNPDITFNINDEVWVIFINGDSKSKFVISRRAI